MLTRHLVFAALLATPISANAQAFFSYGDEIRGNLAIVGPVYFSEGTDIAAMAAFDMVGSVPQRDTSYLDAATSAACIALREQILAAAKTVREEDYNLIAIQFRWPTGDKAPSPTTINYTGVYISEDCAPLNPTKGQ